MKRRIMALLLAACMLLPLTACGASEGGAVDLAQSITAHPLDRTQTRPGLHGETAISDLAVKLLQTQTGEESVLLSPVSIFYALALTINGAEGDTLCQMEETLGMSRDNLNAYLSDYLHALTEKQDDALHMANSLWLRDEENRLTVNPDFLQTNVDYYDAQIFAASFDESTVKNINGWVKKSTDGMIEKLLDEIPVEAVAYLVNALSFEDKWQTPYEDDQVQDGTFHGRQGDENCRLMWSDEHTYLTDDHATGFMKYYDGYAFAALLPEEGMSVEDYAASLSGEKLRGILENPTYCTVQAALPKFTSESTLDLADALAMLGMTDLFDSEKADLSGMGSSALGNLFVSRVLHKTFIDVNESGTRAAAVTAVEVKDACAAPDEEMPPQVILDRPFVYLIVDTDTMLPLFIGTCMDV